MYASKSKYEQFQEWMNKCPVDILDYVDNVDTVNVMSLIHI